MLGDHPRLKDGEEQGSGDAAEEATHEQDVEGARQGDETANGVENTKGDAQATTTTEA